LEIYSFDELKSTQTHLISKLNSGVYQTPCAVISAIQTNGIGSRNNSWVGAEGNFFASFGVNVFSLPSDLPISSMSIYFSWIMREVLRDFGLDVWLKWPNDFYYNDSKVGGTITKKIGDSIVFGIGINLNNSKDEYKTIDTDVESVDILEAYIERLEQYPKWKHIFIEYKIEFKRSRDFSVHIDNKRVSLKDAILCKDGSLILDGKRIFSLR